MNGKPTAGTHQKKIGGRSPRPPRMNRTPRSRARRGTEYREAAPLVTEYLPGMERRGVVPPYPPDEPNTEKPHQRETECTERTGSPGPHGRA